MLKLNKVQFFWRRSLGTKVFISWGLDTYTVTISDTAINWLECAARPQMSLPCIGALHTRAGLGAAGAGPDAVLSGPFLGTKVFVGWTADSHQCVPPAWSLHFRL